MSASFGTSIFKFTGISAPNGIKYIDPSKIVTPSPE